jgi:hypothetical protein
MPNETIELSPEVKSLIRSYMFKLCIPSGIGLVIFSAIGGFLLNEVGRSEAYTKAYSEAAKSVVDTASAAAGARKEAEIRAEAAAASSQAAEAKAREAQASLDKLTTLINSAPKEVQQVIDKTRSEVESMTKRDPRL